MDNHVAQIVKCKDIIFIFGERKCRRIDGLGGQVFGHFIPRPLQVWMRRSNFAETRCAIRINDARYSFPVFVTDFYEAIAFFHDAQKLGVIPTAIHFNFLIKANLNGFLDINFFTPADSLVSPGIRGNLNLVYVLPPVNIFKIFGNGVGKVFIFDRCIPRTQRIICVTHAGKHTLTDIDPAVVKEFFA